MCPGDGKEDTAWKMTWGAQRGEISLSPAGLTWHLENDRFRETLGQKLMAETINK